MISSQRALEVGKDDQTLLPNSDKYQRPLVNRNIIEQDAALNAPFCEPSNFHGLLF
jgi:hypothetical protein